MGRRKAYDIEEVVERAMHVFWANGYDGTSVRMLETEMGINQFSIYNTFGNKHNLFLKAMTAYKKFVEDNLLNIIINSNGKIEDIRTAFLGFGLAVQSKQLAHSCLMVNTSLENTADTCEINDNLNLYFDFVRETLFDLLEKAKMNNELPHNFDSKVHASYLLGSLQGLAVFAKHSSKTEVIEYINVVINTIK